MWSAFYKGRGGFFSTQLFFLSRNLSVAEQAVDDAYQVLDSVYFGSAKRQVEAITPALAGPQFQKISLEDFLSWTKVFVASEAPEMIQETGKVGARSVFITLTTLHAIAAAAQTTIANERFQHKRVTRVWKELVANLLRARDDAKTAAQTLEP